MFISKAGATTQNRNKFSSKYLEQLLFSKRCIIPRLKSTMDSVTLEQISRDLEGVPELTTRSKVCYLICWVRNNRNKPPNLECGQTIYPCIGCGGLFENTTCLARHLTFRLIFIAYACEFCNCTVYSFNRCYLIWHMQTHDHPSNVFNLSDFVIKYLPPKYSLFDFDCSWVLDIYRMPGFIYSGVCSEIDYDFFEPKRYVLFNSPLPKYEANATQRTVLIVPSITSVTSFRQSTINITEERTLVAENPDTVWIESTVHIRPTISFRLPFEEDIPYLTEIDQNMDIEIDYSENDEMNNELCRRVLITGDRAGNVKQEAVIKNESADARRSLFGNSYEISDDADLRCQECSTHLNKNMTLHNHFQGFTQGKPTNPNLVCQVCNLAMLSECSLQAHVRLHDKIAPHSCPECGKTFETHDELYNHSLFVCFHQQKLMRSRCPARRCSRIFASDDTLRTHLLSVHVGTVRKCLNCNYVGSFFDVQAHDFENHMGGERMRTLDICSCQICIPPIPITNDAKIIEEHMERHINSSNKMYVYHCSYCTKIYRSKETIAQHTIQCERKFTTSTTEQKSNICPLCGKHYVKSCINCNKFNLKSHQNYKRLNPAYVNSQTADMLKCPLCDEKYANEKLTIHLETMHSMNFVIPRVVKIDHNLDPDTKSANLSAGLEMQMDDSILENKLPLEISDAHSDEEIEAIINNNDGSDLMNLSTDFEHQIKIEDFSNNTNDEIEIKMETNDEFQCKVCTVMCYTKSRFIDHIKQHRNESTQFQCMECGLCFTAKPSFTKHLLCCHSIIDGDKYIEDNNCVDLIAIRELQQDLYYNSNNPRNITPLLNNQCRICYSVFNCQTDLNKHFRVHGMAFLMKNTSHKDE